MIIMYEAVVKIVYLDFGNMGTVVCGVRSKYFYIIRVYKRVKRKEIEKRIVCSVRVCMARVQAPLLLMPMSILTSPSSPRYRSFFRFSVVS